MRVLAGGPARETGSELFELHVEGLKANRTDGMTLTVRHELLPDPGGPKWDKEKMYRVGECRQRFLDATVGEGYDALWMVDTDLICGPGVLKRMLAVEADVVYGVFWSAWQNLPRVPQVWDSYPFGHSEELVTQMSDGLEMVESKWGFEVGVGRVHEVEVLGGGACTLFRRRAFEARYHPPLGVLDRANSMWRGEDRRFCVDLIAKDVKQVAVMGLPIAHLDTPQKQGPEALAEARLMFGL